jgi:hypothetical protein
MSLRGDIDRIKTAVGEERWPPAAIAIFACSGRGLYTEVPLLNEGGAIHHINSGGAGLVDHDIGADLRFPLREPPADGSDDGR